jgi:hypothetical protein
MQVNGELYLANDNGEDRINLQSSLNMFSDTNGSTWQDMMKNKLDYCISTIDTNRYNVETFINGGWNGRNYGFGLFSKIGNVYQLIWTSSDATYYCRKLGNGNYDYKDKSGTDVPVVLYDNSTGTNGNVTLSSSSANYTYLEIFYRGNDNQYSSVKVFEPNGKEVSLLVSLTYNNRIYFKQKIVNISGTSISNKNYSEGWFNGSNQQGWSAANNIYITRVIGYY